LFTSLLREDEDTSGEKVLLAQVLDKMNPNISVLSCSCPTTTASCTCNVSLTAVRHWTPSALLCATSLVGSAALRLLTTSTSLARWRSATWCSSSRCLRFDGFLLFDFIETGEDVVGSLPSLLKESFL